MHPLPAHRDEVRPLGPTRRSDLVHRFLAVGVGVLALAAVFLSPFLALVLFGVALAIVMDRRGVFGRGRYRAIMGFIAAPWIGLAGIGLALLGSIPEPGNFFLLPGLLLVGISLALLAWSSVTIWQTRRSGAAEID